MNNPPFPPQYFNSQEEYDGYLQCVSKAKPGDRVLACFKLLGGRGNHYHPSNISDEDTRFFYVYVAKAKPKNGGYLMVGTNADNLGFSPVGFGNYAYTYYIVLNDIKIVKIERKLR